MKCLRSTGAGETSTDEKTGKNSEKQRKTVILAPKLAVTAQKFKILNSNLTFKPLFALLTSNITYMKRLWSMGAVETSTDEKTAKTVKTVILAPKRPLQLKNSNFEFKI